MSMPPQAGAG